VPQGDVSRGGPVAVGDGERTEVEVVEAERVQPAEAASVVARDGPSFVIIGRPHVVGPRHAVEQQGPAVRAHRQQPRHRYRRRGQGAVDVGLAPEGQRRARHRSCSRVLAHDDRTTVVKVDRPRSPGRALAETRRADDAHARLECDPAPQPVGERGHASPASGSGAGAGSGGVDPAPSHSTPASPRRAAIRYGTYDVDEECVAVAGWATGKALAGPVPPALADGATSATEGDDSDALGSEPAPVDSDGDPIPALESPPTSGAAPVSAAPASLVAADAPTGKASSPGGANTTRSVGVLGRMATARLSPRCRPARSNT